MSDHRWAQFDIQSQLRRLPLVLFAALVAAAILHLGLYWVCSATQPPTWVSGVHARFDSTAGEHQIVYSWHGRWISIAQIETGNKYGGGSDPAWFSSALSQATAGVPSPAIVIVGSAPFPSIATIQGPPQRFALRHGSLSIGRIRLLVCGAVANYLICVLIILLCTTTMHSARICYRRWACLCVSCGYPIDIRRPCPECGHLHEPQSRA